MQSLTLITLVQAMFDHWLLTDAIILTYFDLIRHEAANEPCEQSEAQNNHLKLIHDLVQQLLVNSNWTFCFENLTLCLELNGLYSKHQCIISSSNTDNCFMHIIFQWYPCE